MLTLPNLIQDYQNRSWKTTASTFERKLGEALRVMNSQALLNSFDDTKSFLEDGLAKQIKILKICDSATDCFSSKIMKNEKDKIDVAAIVNSGDLGHAEFETKSLGVQFANGISAIIAYNPYFFTTNDNEVVQFSKTKSGNKEYVNISTNAISMVYDVSGLQKPNMIGQDLFTINSTLGMVGACTQIGDYFCIKDIGTNYKSINCQYSDINAEYCPSSGGVAQDYYSGAIKACTEEGLTLATQEQLKKLYVLSNEGYKGIPTAGIYTAAISTHPSWQFVFNFDTNTEGQAWRTEQHSALCVNN